MNKCFLSAILGMGILCGTPSGGIGAAYDERAIPFLAFGESGDGRRDVKIHFRNNTNAPATLQLEMYDNQGQPFEIPFDGDQGGIVRLTRHVLTVSPNASQFFETASRGTPLQWGWLRVISSPPGAITVTAQGFRENGMPGKREYEIETVVPKRSFQIVPLGRAEKEDYVVANTGAHTDRVTLITRNGNGVELCRLQAILSPGASNKARIGKDCKVNGGRLEVLSERGAIAAMVMSFTADGTVIPLYDFKFLW